MVSLFEVIMSARGLNNPREVWRVANYGLKDLLNLPRVSNHMLKDLISLLEMIMSA